MADTDPIAQMRVAFSRSAGLPPHMGKCDNAVKTLVPDVVKQDLARRSREVGMGEAELVRLWILERLYGFEMVAMMDRKRLELACSVGQESDRNPT